MSNAAAAGDASCYAATAAAGAAAANFLRQYAVRGSPVVRAVAAYCSYKYRSNSLIIFCLVRGCTNDRIICINYGGRNFLCVGVIL